MAWYMHALTIQSGGVKHVSVKYRQSYINSKKYICDHIADSTMQYPFKECWIC